MGTGIPSTNVALLMIPNPDPKPGRWILPLVIVGMVGFTYLFVNALAGTPEEDETTTTPPDGTTTTTAEVPGTTVPTTPTEVEEYLAGLAEDQQTLLAISDEMEAVNQEWDDRTIQYGAAEQRLVDLVAEAQTFVDAVELPGPPAGFAGLALAHEEVFAAATNVQSAVEAVLAGLRAPDSGEERRAALETFRAAVTAFDDKVAAARTAAEQPEADTA